MLYIVECPRCSGGLITVEEVTIKTKKGPCYDYTINEVLNVDGPDGHIVFNNKRYSLRTILIVGGRARCDSCNALIDLCNLMDR